ncbi:hypothetical protein D9M69_655600 [compost metagenome]
MGLQVSEFAVICGWQAVPVTLAKPYAAGLATISCNNVNVFSGITRRPAVLMAPYNALLYVVASWVPPAMAAGTCARKPGVTPRSGTVGTRM